MTVLDEINKDYQYTQKTISIKRRLNSPDFATDKYFDDNWLDITDYVLECDTITWNIDDVEVNEFTQGDFTLTLINRLQEFAPETNSGSFFSGYLTRHRTKVKVTAGYIDSVTGTTYTYDVGVGLIDGTDINAESDSTITVPCLSPSMIFDEQMAEDVYDGYIAGGVATSTTSDRLIDATGVFDEFYVGYTVRNITTGEDTEVKEYVSATELIVDRDIFSAGDTYDFNQQKKWWRSQTISQLVQKIYDVQRKGKYLIHPFIDGATITPGNDITIPYADFTDLTCREALNKLAEVSNSCWYIDNNWFLIYKSRTPAGASVFTFTNQGLYANILSASEYSDGLKKVLTRVSWKDSQPLVYAEESAWEIGDNSSTWKYGNSKYEIENNFVSDRTIQKSICTSLLQEFVLPKEEITLETKFIPHLSLLDKVTVNYVGVPAKSPGWFWNKSYWNKSYWTGRIGGIQLNNRSMRIIKIEYDVNNWTCNFKVRGE